LDSRPIDGGNRDQAPAGDHREDSEIAGGVGIFPDVRENPRKKLEE
jgi:hypothetical protein